MPLSELIASRRYRLFHFLWCLFIIIHHSITIGNWTTIGSGWLQSGNVFYLILGVITLVLLVLSILKPSKIWLFAAALLSWSILKFGNMPFIPNHIIFAIIINLSLLSAIGLAYLSPGKNLRRPKKSEIIKYTAPILRWMLLILYFFTVFHKLNSDYFNPIVSCGIELYQEIKLDYPFLPDGSVVNWILIIGTLSIELIIPILLILPKTRLFGILLGLIFHLSLALHHNLMIFSFSFELFALYSLFLPSRSVQFIFIKNNFYKHKLLRGGIRHLIKQISFFAVFQLILIGSLIIIKPFPQLPPNQQQLIVANLFFITFLFIASVAYMIIKGHNDEKPICYSIDKKLLIIFPVLLLLNGFSPYLGIKTATNFSMFSNLEVKNNKSNHFIIPNTISIFNHSNVLVDIIKSNYPPLQKIKKNNEFIPLFELERMADKYQEAEHFYVAYRLGDQIYKESLNNKKTDKSLWLQAQRKFLIYRNVAKLGPCSCQW